MEDLVKIQELGNALETLQKLCDSAKVASVASAAFKFSLVGAGVFQPLALPEITPEERIISALSEAPSLTDMLIDDLKRIVPPRVAHLALYGSKNRVRNKNWNRMWKIHKRYIQCKQ